MGIRDRPPGELLVGVPNEENTTNTQLFKLENKRAVFIDSTYFEVFDFKNEGFKWIYGSPSASLTEPFTVVLSQQLAAKFFGDENPVGKSLEFFNHSLK